MADPPAFLKKAGDMMVQFVDAFIEFDKARLRHKYTNTWFSCVLIPFFEFFSDPSKREGSV